ncbi:MAG: hypothetical protein M1358_03665 [Chloroflexi bacterium]|nr:hypothetical protein [Chloroflexota bacterium]
MSISQPKQQRLESLFDTIPDELGGLSSNDDVEAGSVRREIHARRMSTLRFTSVLHHLEMHKLRRGEWWDAYDLLSLQLHTIQAVVDQMGFLEGGITRLALTETIVDLAQKMAPDHDSAEHREVARVVVDWLLNTEESNVFAPSYLDVMADGNVVRRQANIDILRERQEPDGSLVLRASVEAINLLLGVLNEDVADAQKAEERLLNDYIAGSRYDVAIAQATRAQLRSIQYAEQISRWLLNAWLEALACDGGLFTSNTPNRLPDLSDIPSILALCAVSHKPRRPPEFLLPQRWQLLHVILHLRIVDGGRAEELVKDAIFEPSIWR